MVSWQILGLAVSLGVVAAAWYLFLKPMSRKKKWEGAASSLGFSFVHSDAGPFIAGSMKGRLDGFAVSLQHRPKETGAVGADGGNCEVVVRFPESLGIGLELRGGHLQRRWVFRIVVAVLSCLGAVPITLAALEVIPLLQGIIVSALYGVITGIITLVYRAEKRRTPETSEVDLDAGLAENFTVGESQIAREKLSEPEILRALLACERVGTLHATDIEIKLVTSTIPTNEKEIESLIGRVVALARRLADVEGVDSRM